MEEVWPENTAELSTAGRAEGEGRDHLMPYDTLGSTSDVYHAALSVLQKIPIQLPQWAHRRTQGVPVLVPPP